MKVILVLFGSACKRCTLKIVPYGAYLFVSGSTLSCCQDRSFELARIESNNIELTKSLHSHLKHHDWPAVGKCFAQNVRFRDESTRHEEVQLTKEQFMPFFKVLMVDTNRTTIEIRQLYPAGAYHVIVEGTMSGEPFTVNPPVCLIYTIENNRITKLHAY